MEYLTTIAPYVPNSTYGRVAVGLSSAAVLYTFGLAVYRLVFSPLAGFPGPKIAALTSWYEFYHDVWRPGYYLYEIEKMHQKYGPVVRINPHELSIHDPDFYNELYVSGSVRRTENYSHFANGIDFEGSHFLSTGHDLHRKRRKPLEPFFSRLGVAKLEPMVAELVAKFVGRLDELKGTHSVIRLDHAFVAFSGDVIGRVCCDDREEFLSDPEFAPQWFDLLHTVIHSIPLFMNFSWIIQLISLIPESLIAWADPRSQGFNNFKSMANNHIIKAKQDKAAGKKQDPEARVTLFRHLINTDLPESELSVERLAKEAQVLLGAGTVSTARTLDFICYYIMARPQIRQRLGEEVKDLMAQYPAKHPSWADLEKLPYLQAIIKEGLRLSYGVMHRLPRVSPDVDIPFKQWKLPRGVIKSSLIPLIFADLINQAPVGMSAYLMHSDPKIYEKPKEFIPERWLGDINPAMNRSLVPFSKGSRNCLGMNLAYVELNFVLATLFRPGGPDIELFETTERDTTQHHDYLIPLPRLDSKGMRIMVN
ncbi:MAG: hypothetical protein M1814_002821 [Vezdaea aestivalis]|nr:MAG: hypothetical protein M1814_002821 [Vezdaea aestivalis]